jgi:HEAT repeat protein
MDENPKVRAAAAYALGELGGVPDAALELCRAMGDPAAEVQRQSALALTALGEAAVPELRKLLKDKESPLRREAVQVLAAMGSDARSAAEDLALLLKDKDATLRAAAASALAALGKDAQDAMPTLLEVLRTDKNYQVQLETFQAITLVGSKEPAKLQQALREINETTRWAAPFVLKQFGPKAKDAVPHLTRALGNKDAGTRLAAALALGEIGAEAKAAASALAKAQQDTSPQVRVAAAAALASVDPKQEALAKQQFVVALAQTEKAMAASQARLQKTGQILQRAAAQGLVRPIDWRAVNDPAVQSYYQQIIDQKIFLSAYRKASSIYSPNWGSVEWTKLIDEVDRRIAREFGPEGIPALVRGVNLSGIYKLGFC